MRNIVALFLALIMCLSLIACGSKEENVGVYVQPLSSTCDYILCCGTDFAGNVYELVANQKESALGYEIKVGIIKNNEWLYPMSTDFPFLGEKGLFHVSAPVGHESGYDLSMYNTIVSSIYFIDSGAFLMKSNYIGPGFFKSYEDNLIIISCETLKSCAIDYNDVHFLYRSKKAKFDYYGELVSYGQITSDEGKLLMYSERERPQANSLNVEKYEDYYFYDWILLDTVTLEKKTLAADVIGLYPKSDISDGLIFASDQCFYDANLQKMVDLSAYDIDMSCASSIFFDNGICEFTAENDLGTEFIVTIDKTGKVLSEVKK